MEKEYYSTHGFRDEIMPSGCSDPWPDYNNLTFICVDLFLFFLFKD